VGRHGPRLSRRCRHGQAVGVVMTRRAEIFQNEIETLRSCDITKPMGAQRGEYYDLDPS
jgi:hypothetical protein